jgi:hypothetical protein
VTFSRNLLGSMAFAALFTACADEPEGVEGADGYSDLTRQVASIRGVVTDAIPDEPLIVDVVYAVEPGEDAEEVGLQALFEAAPTAIPYDRWRYTFIDIVWDNLPVNIYYNGSGVDSSVAGDDHAGTYQTALQTWNNVSSSDFAFNYAGTTNRCPSLVKECGRQTFDGNNDTTWIALAGSASTLAITWTGTSTDEADQAYNTNDTWSIGDAGTPDIDFLTVAIHENGHSLGLGHSSVSGAIMDAYYHGVQWSLSADDIAAVSAKYPSGGGGGGGGGGTCTLAQVGDSCSVNADCCSNKCKGPSGGKTCK